MSTSRRPFRVRRLGAVIACAALAASVLAVTPAFATYRQTYQFDQARSVASASALITPYGVAVGSDGAVYVAGNLAFLPKFTGDWTTPTLFGIGNPFIWSMSGDAGLDEVRGVAVSGSNVWALDYSTGAAMFQDSGFYSGPAITSAATPLNNPTAIALESTRAVYIADMGSSAAYSHRVSRFNADGGYSGIHFGDTGTSESNWMQSIRGLAVGPDATVYAADDTAGKVWRYRPNALTEEFDQLASFSSSTLYAEPIGVATAADGSVFILDGDTGTVTKLDSAGRVLAHWGGLGVIAGQFSNPQGIAVDATGTVYVTDRDAQLIHTFTPLDLGPTTAAAGTVTVKKGKTATFKFMASDDFSNSCNVTIKIYKGSSLKKSIVVGKVSQGSWHTKTWKDTLAKGTYTWKVFASDLTGHSQRNVASRAFKVK